MWCDKSFAKVFAQCSLAMPTVPYLRTNYHCSLPGDVYGSLPGNICQFPALSTLAVLAWDGDSSMPEHSCQCACPAWDCLQSLPWTLANSRPVIVCQCLPGHVLQSLPGTLCKFSAWERLPMPLLGMFASPCVGKLIAGDAVPLLFFHAYLHMVKSDKAKHPLQINDCKTPLNLQYCRVPKNGGGGGGGRRSQPRSFIFLHESSQSRSQYFSIRLRVTWLSL